MDVFVFASSNLTNIWAGIGARLWAVSQTGNSTTTKGRRTKSQSMRVGSFGILYCSETHALTTPFIVYSKPNLEKIVGNVWPEKEGWILPFRIFPLGNPNRQLSSEEAKRVLPIFRSSENPNFGNVFRFQGVTAFVPTKIGTDDWEVIIGRLADIDPHLV